ncbi:unnamed protein product [Protopolystoma xenopodis]|uniref:Uncharacterized protein n=1 Tax=Protopolystoma xenopodis TaxID=117903 RepID=A0A448WVF4_9PLAT|nr:unnamed protein product [Protopolystoma xenopodis]
MNGLHGLEVPARRAIHQLEATIRFINISTNLPTDLIGLSQLIGEPMQVDDATLAALASLPPASACELRLDFLQRFLSLEELGTASNATAGASGAGVGPGASSASGPTANQSAGSSSGSLSASAAAATSAVAAVTSVPGGASFGTGQVVVGVLMTLEVIRNSPASLLLNIRFISRGIINLLSRHLSNLRLMRACAGFLRGLLNRFPADASPRQKLTTQPELVEIYTTWLKVIQEAFNLPGDG